MPRQYETSSAKQGHVRPLNKFYMVPSGGMKESLPQRVHETGFEVVGNLPLEPGPMSEEGYPDELADAMLFRREQEAQERGKNRRKAWQSQMSWGRDVSAGNHIYGNNLAHNLGNIVAPALFSLLDRRRANKTTKREE